MNRLLFNGILAYLALCPATLAYADDLSGKYKVRGECAYRTEAGAYKACIAWNELELERINAKNEYNFRLTTNTFATTQGSCLFEGSLRLEGQSGSPKLVRSDGVEDNCHFEIEVTPKSLVLNVPKSESHACQESCGFNASLYSDPFPRKRVKRK